MSKKLLKQQMLNEAIKKFKMISEYSFYTGNVSEEGGEDELPDDLAPAGDSGDDLEASPEDANDAADAVSSELGMDGEDDMAPEEEPVAPAAPAPIAAPAEPPSDEVELDVTELVQGSDEAKDAAESASMKASQIMAKLSQMDKMMANMNKITSNIETLEKELIKRNPTPVEKLEMRSLNSYPYSQKLSDYWADKEGPYDVMNQNNKPKEYVLTQDVVDSTYNEKQIGDSLTNPFEEEDF